MNTKSQRCAVRAISTHQPSGLPKGVVARLGESGPRDFLTSSVKWLSQLLVNKIEWNKFHFVPNVIAFKMNANLTSDYTNRTILQFFPGMKIPLSCFFLTQSVCFHSFVMMSSRLKRHLISSLSSAQLTAMIRLLVLFRKWCCYCYVSHCTSQNDHLLNRYLILSVDQIFMYFSL